MAASPTERLDDLDDLANRHTERIAIIETNDIHTCESLSHMREEAKNNDAHIRELLGCLVTELREVAKNADKGFAKMSADLSETIEQYSRQPLICARSWQKAIKTDVGRLQRQIQWAVSLIVIIGTSAAGLMLLKSLISGSGTGP